MRRVLVVAVLSTVLWQAAPAAAHDDDLTPPWLGNVPGLGAIAPDGTPADVPVRMSGCTISNPMFAADPVKARSAVPSRHQLATNPYIGPGRATVIASVLACDSLRVYDGPARRTVVTAHAVQVVAEPTGDPLWDAYNRSAMNFLPSSTWYLLAAQTDHPELAGLLRGAGLPATYTPGLSWRSDYAGVAKTDSVSAAGYSLSTSTLLADPFVHNHDWTFWTDTPQGPRGLFLHLRAMTDSSCGYTLSPLLGALLPCGATLTAPAGSSVATILGERARTPFAFNHPPSAQPGYLTLIGGEQS